ncbi:MAG: DNA replication/repair protein RecF [Bacilli bacterium]|nr:DNA replication/repair protein RecF [Bacilli bacterium]
MLIKNIELSNFRNYKKLKLDFSPNINIIYGQNAQGKTNLLESIYYLSKLKSHRISNDSHLIREDSIKLNLKGVVINNSIETKYEIILSDNEKKFKIDNDIIKKISDYVSNIDTIIFYPEDLEIIKGSPGIRREYINDELSQLYINYYKILSDYNKLLKMKNDYLKNNNYNIDINYLKILNSYFIDKGVIIYRMRKKFIDKINEYCNNIFKTIMGLAGFSLQYIPSIDFDFNDIDNMKKIFKEEIEKNQADEFRLKTSIVGPHRDDINFCLNNKDLKKYGSQGQQRIAVLCMKLSEIEIFKKYKNSTPILLLDDIFSELDDSKKNNLLKYINNDIQVIITTTDLNKISKKILKNSKLIEINSGKIKTIKEVEK